MLGENADVLSQGRSSVSTPTSADRRVSINQRHPLNVQRGQRAEMVEEVAPSAGRTTLLGLLHPETGPQTTTFWLLECLLQVSPGCLSLLYRGSWGFVAQTDSFQILACHLLAM